MNNSNRYLEAFKENFNLVGLAGIAATAMAFTTPIPLLIGLVAEVAYLMFYADSRWYAVRMAKKFDSEVEARREDLKAKILPLLKPEMRSRFLRLEDVRRGIGENADDNKEWFREVLRKLDFLLEKWLHFAAKDVQFRRYLEAVLRDECGVSPQNETFAPSQIALPPMPARRGKGTSSVGAAVPRAAARDADEVWTQDAVNQIQAQYDGEMDGIRQLIAVETDDTTKPVLEKRLEVLTRRREFVGKIGRIQTNLSHQLNLLEDSFGLISDEIRARPPQQVLSDIEDVVSQTNTMTQLLEDIAPYEQMLSS
ncbi:MAG TPA: hypothetical protein VF681_06190 [Abditibacteriaceae bacterium]|jgi:hypothetical protein